MLVRISRCRPLMGHTSLDLAASCRPAWPSLSLRLLVLLIAVLLPLLASCRLHHPMNIVLISIDTIRADHLGCYGSSSVRTPHLDALAQRSQRFAWCFSAVPITLPSHTTMLTGLYPLRHSVRDNGTFTVPESLPTVATVLAERGWTTIGVIGAYPITARFGLARGFEVWDEELDQSSDDLLPLAFTQRSADHVTHAALRHLQRHTGEEPLFLFVHYFDPHRPWNAPALYARQYRDDPYGAEIAFTDACIGELLRGIKRLGLSGRTAVIVTGDHGEGLSDHEEETHSFLLYNGTTRVPLLVSAPGLEPGVESWPVSVADVAPTILDLAGIEPRAMDGRSLLAAPDPQRLIYLESLAGRLQHGWNDMRGAVIGEHKLILGPEPELFAYADDPGETSDRQADEPEMAHRLEHQLRRHIDSGRDAGQELALAERYSAQADPEVARQLEALGYVVSQSSPVDLSELGEIAPQGDPRKHLEVVEIQSVARSLISAGRNALALETLGKAESKYPEDLEIERLLVIAHSLAGDIEQARDRARRLRQRPEAAGRDHSLAASVLQQAGETDEGLAAIAVARELEPEREHELTEARILAGAGRPAEAVAVLEELIAAVPCSRPALIRLAAVHRATGNPQATRQTYQALLSCSPRDVPALFNLGNLAFAEGDLELAEQRFAAATRLDPGYGYARYGLALVAMQRNDRSTAVRLLREVLAFEPLDSPLGSKTTALLQGLEENNDGAS